MLQSDESADDFWPTTRAVKSAGGLVMPRVPERSVPTSPDLVRKDA